MMHVETGLLIQFTGEECVALHHHAERVRFETANLGHGWVKEMVAHHTAISKIIKVAVNRAHNSVDPAQLDILQ